VPCDSALSCISLEFIYPMGDRKEVWVQWLSLFGLMTGMPCPEDHSDESLRRFYRELCRAFHPDKQSCDTGHQDRAKHFFQTLTNV
jgi:hypothetical protein